MWSSQSTEDLEQVLLFEHDVLFSGGVSSSGVTGCRSVGFLVFCFSRRLQYSWNHKQPRARFNNAMTRPSFSCSVFLGSRYSVVSGWRIDFREFAECFWHQYQNQNSRSFAAGRISGSTCVAGLDSEPHSAPDGPTCSSQQRISQQRENNVSVCEWVHCAEASQDVQTCISDLGVSAGRMVALHRRPLWFLSVQVWLTGPQLPAARAAVAWSRRTFL